MGKYDRLGTWLREQGTRHIPMTFAQVERIVGFALPESQNHQSWWSNSTSNNVMTKVWLDAGYRTEQVDVAGKKLVFRKIDRSSGLDEEPRMFAPAEPARFPLLGQKVDRHPASGALKGMFTIEPGYDIASSDPDEVAEWEAAIDRHAALYEAGRSTK
ncbi:MAG: hypothetical protein WDM91_18620 [Rhizomicrobium sp.]